MIKTQVDMIVSTMSKVVFVMSLVIGEFIHWIKEEKANVLKSDYGPFLLNIFLLMTGIKFINLVIYVFKLIKVGINSNQNSNILDDYTELQDIVIHQ